MWLGNKSIVLNLIGHLGNSLLLLGKLFDQTKVVNMWFKLLRNDSWSLSLSHLFNKAIVPDMWLNCSKVLELTSICNQTMLFCKFKNVCNVVLMNNLRSWINDHNLFCLLNLFWNMGDVICDLFDILLLLVSFSSLEWVPEQVLKVRLSTRVNESVSFSLLKNLSKMILMDNLWSWVNNHYILG